MAINFTDLIEYANISDVGITPKLLQGFAFSGTLPMGQYALAWQERDCLLLARDPIGCNKLFFGHSEGGHFFVANRITRLLAEGIGIDRIFSTPPGRIISVSKKGVAILGGNDLTALEPDPKFSLPIFQQFISNELKHFFNWLARKYKGRRFVVCLSGGMDSSIIASYASKYLPSTVAAVFSYISENDTKALMAGYSHYNFPSLSDDFRHATEVARVLGLKVLPVFRPSSAVATTVSDALFLCQDWRDFNVHCASVNLFLAQSIRAAYPGEDVIVLTGDLMNEYVCDYKSEEVDGHIYYSQPRVPPLSRRRFFIRGLDAGDREIGVFAAFGLVPIQPFARVANHYLRIPVSLIEFGDAKWSLNGPLLNKDVADVVSRSKCRAQVGGRDGGTLAIYHRLGLNQDRLFSMWSSAVGLDDAQPRVKELIQFGRYRQAPTVKD